ncbi:MAG TPA: hypothetical protein VL068_11575 [Microthrixaceae bacterium]|nr:hypothetical protein [Microthrixaceae bacterium]
MADTETSKRQPSPEHIEAMGRGRKAAAAVGSYLEALERNKPQRGRRVPVEQLEARLSEAREMSESATGLIQLNAAQAVMDLEKRIADAKAPEQDLSQLEDGFVEWASTYAKSKGISYDAFRKVGVTPAVLRRANISR